MRNFILSRTGMNWFNKLSLVEYLYYKEDIRNRPTDLNDKSEVNKEKILI
ncbi:hypothetical protein [Clostridium butyricum]|nr:hypothetical protein [Clostridium butyricum]